MADDGSVKGVRERQRDATRAAVLDAALHLFAERGFEGTAIRDVAARADVNHAMIQYYFKTKERLWREAVDFLFARITQQVTFSDVDAFPSKRAFAEHAIRRYVRYCARHPEHARLMIQESIRDGERLDWAAKRYIVHSKRAAEQFIVMMQNENLMPQGSVAALTYILVGASQLFYALAPEVRRVWGVDPTDEAQIEAHADAVVAVMLR